MNQSEEKTKICKSCKERINVEAKKCPKCGSRQRFPIWIAILIFILAIIFIGIASAPSIDENSRRPSSSQTFENDDFIDEDDNTSNNKTSYTFGETFVFDNLEIKIDADYSFKRVDNEFSDYHKKIAVKLPVTVKNLSDETHGLNMFYYDVYGSTGTEVATLSSYFKESLDYAGDLRSKASYKKYMYFLYDGNGKYTIEFDNYSEKKVVEMQIEK